MNENSNSKDRSKKWAFLHSRNRIIERISPKGPKILIEFERLSNYRISKKGGSLMRVS